MTCLEKIIGLSRKDCECFVADRPVDYNVSLSGLFLDELPGVSQFAIATSIECGEGSIWDIMNRALENGEKLFTTDLLSNMAQKFKDAFKTFEGIIGKREFNGEVPDSILNDLHGIRIESNCIKGSCIIIKGVEAFFDTTLVGVVATIYRTGDDNPFDTFTFDTEAGIKKVTILATPIELELFIDGLDEFNYSIVYDLPPGVKPLNTQFGCACSSNRKKNGWDHWLLAEGISSPAFTTVAALDDTAGSDFTFGLNLNAKIFCKKSTIICEDGNPLDFENDEIALQIAHAIQRIAAVFMLTEILEGPDTAKFAMNEEMLNHLIGQYSEDYDNRVQYIALHITPNNDCYVCNDQIAVTGIKS